MAARLSIVICTCNRARSLAGTLGRLAAQTATADRFEVLVVNNGCTDDTPAVISAARAAQPGLREVVEPKPGQAYARVRGVREAQADWVAFVDDDNFLEPGWVAAALAFIDAHPEAGAFGGRVIVQWETQPPDAVARRAWAYAETDLGANARRLGGEERWKLRGAGLVCRKASLAATGWLDWQACVGRIGSGSLAGDDTEIVLRLARDGGEIWYEPALCLHHQISADRATLPKLEALCRGFARADPMLLGLRAPPEWSAWVGGLALMLARRTFAIARHALHGMVSPDARVTARLTVIAWAGLLQGLGAVRRLDARERRLWRERNATRFRVLHLHRGEAYGGIERMLACLASERALCPAMEPVFALSAPERVVREIRASGARVEALGPMRISRPWQIGRGVWRAWRLMRRERVNAVICHGSWPLVVFCWITRRSRRILWMHSDTKIRNKNVVERLANWVRPELVICNSVFTAASLPLLFSAPLPPHTVVACPVCQPANLPPREETRSRLGAAPEGVVIALVGRPVPWKGQPLLIEALAQLAGVPGWILWQIGGATNAAETAHLEGLRATAKAAGIEERVHFLGERDDVQSLFAAADVFCQPNRTPEPFGIVFVEALYAGLPVVTGDHGGAVEIVDATCGLLLPPGDVDALAAALHRLIEDADLRRTLGAAAPGRALAVSDPAKILAQLYALMTRG